MKTKYLIKYCGRKLDEVEARYPKEALEKVRDKINFEVIEETPKLSSKKGCGAKGYIPINNGRGRTTAICGCVNGWLCDKCSPTTVNTEKSK